MADDTSKPPDQTNGGEAQQVRQQTSQEKKPVERPKMIYVQDSANPVKMVRYGILEKE